MKYKIVMSLFLMTTRYKWRKFLLFYREVRKELREIRKKLILILQCIWRGKL